MSVIRQHRSHADRWNNTRQVRERLLRTVCFGVWRKLTEIVGEGCATGLRDKQGPDQCQGKAFTLSLESNEEQFQVLSKVLTYPICIVEKLFCGTEDEGERPMREDIAVV